MNAPWRIPVASQATARGLYGPDPAGTYEWEFTPGLVWEWTWYPNVKNSHFIATQELVDRKAKMGQLLLRGMPYSRKSLDQEALDRIVEWGYPGSTQEVAAEVQLINEAWWDANLPHRKAIWGGLTPEAFIGWYGSGGLDSAQADLDIVFPNRPPKDQVRVTAMSSYP